MGRRLRASSSLEAVVKEGRGVLLGDGWEGGCFRVILQSATEHGTFNGAIGWPLSKERDRVSQWPIKVRLSVAQPFLSIKEERLHCHSKWHDL